MTGQLGQVTLDVVEGGALASLVGVLEQIGGQQLGTFDHAHGDDRRPATAPTSSKHAVVRNRQGATAPVPYRWVTVRERGIARNLCGTV